MAREFIDSFETRSLGLWEHGGHPSTDIVSTVGLDMKGDYCLYYPVDMHILLDGFSEKYFAFSFRASYNSASMHMLDITKHSESYYYRTELYIYADTSNKRIYVYLKGGGGTTVYGPSNTIFQNVTYFIQVYYKWANSGGRVVIKINGSPYINYTGDTRGYDEQPRRVYLGGYGGSGQTYFNNFVVDNSEMPEETEIILIRPTASGFHTDFTATPSGNNYSRVDETPYNDLDYVGSNVENDIDTYNIGPNLPSDTAVVNCVQLQGRAMKDFGATLGKFNFVLRSNNTNYHDSDRTVTETMNTFRNMYLYGPTGSGVWHKTNVDPLEIGVRARA